VEPDPTLRGVERNALIICAAMTLAACFVRPWPEVALGVIGGGLLVGFSYWSLKSGVTVMAAAITARSADSAPAPSTAATPPARSAGKNKKRSAGKNKNLTRELAKLTLRYALLALLAYVMIARLRLHPWGLLAGASSVVAGVSLQALLLITKK
jgi:hypothetical protein